MFWVGILLCVVGAAGLLQFGIFGMLSGAGAIAGLMAPNRIKDEHREANLRFLKTMGAKVLTALIVLGVGVLLIRGSEPSKLENAQEVADSAVRNQPDAIKALAAAADGCVFQLTGRVRNPIVKTTTEGQ